ncbi:histone acetyltransferase hac-like 1 [Phytophthora cinnamomi]|uniref:histone acetyltransferase hac-like 1 n=1 Tax=Phytophthora cinnamomi TaxID=4785 RepID=UPI0035594F27|nr:histone acetyltransferase hac-like 1 [Phytophthora cinnamomi]
MRRPDVVLTPASLPSAAQPSGLRARVRPSAAAGASTPPPSAVGSASGLWTLPPLNQFMTLPGRFLASRFASVDSSVASSPSRHSISNSNSNSNGSSSADAGRHGRSLTGALGSRGAALDGLLNDSDEDWAATRDHFVLPHMVHFQDVYERDGAATQPPEEIDLTVSSSEDEDGGQSGPGAAAADSDGVIEILDVSESSGPPQPAPLRRKRRRPAPADADAVGVAKRRRGTDTRSAESTSISMHNNEQLEKFKAALKCSVCLDVIEDITSTSCGHIFCAGCIHQAIRANGKCPLCQRRLYPKDTHRLFF